MPLSRVRYAALLIVNSSLLSVVGALPVVETTTSREADRKETGSPTVDAYPLRTKTEDPKPFSGGVLKSLQTFGLSRKVVLKEADQEKDDDRHHQHHHHHRRRLHHHLHQRQRNRHHDGDGSEIPQKNKLPFQSCRVANIIYQHMERVPRSDRCETCTCIDSEIYCFWKLCSFNQSTTPSSTSYPVSENVKNWENVSADGTKYFPSKSKDSDETIATNEKYSKIITNERKYNILRKLEETSTANSNASISTLSTSTAAPFTKEPVVCYVMGVMYKYGEVLPKDTGTCLECTCSEGGRVTCSPNDCVSQPDLDYLSHNNNMDLLDIDTF